MRILLVQAAIFSHHENKISNDDPIENRGGAPKENPIAVLIDLSALDADDDEPSIEHDSWVVAEIFNQEIEELSIYFKLINEIFHLIIFLRL